MSTANPPITVTPDVQASLASLCVTFQKAIAASQTAIQQAALSSQENQQRAVRQMQETLRQSLQHLAQSSRDSVESYQNSLKEALSSLNTRFDRLTPDQRTALIHDLTNERLQTVTRDYLDWLVSQSEDPPVKQISVEIECSATIVPSDAPNLESLEAIINEEEKSFTETTRTFLKDTVNTVAENIQSNRDALLKLADSLISSNNDLLVSVGMVLSAILLLTFFKKKSP
jgi:hypothetical protein|nr:MAG TPA: hypothetical protein [Caudoviricetes sp.]